MSATIGQQLRQAREERKLTLDQVAQATRIRIHYLEALESGNFSVLPSAVQVRGFLRTYAGYLKLDVDGLLDVLDSGSSTADQEAQALSLDSTASSSLGQMKTDSESANLIFAEIGKTLKDQRERLGLSLSDVERHTHLSKYYLTALESGNFDLLPSPVQGRGMLNNYAIFLGLEPDSVLLPFAEGLQIRLAERRAKEVKKAPSPVRHRPNLPITVRNIFSTEILIGSALIMFLVTFFVWGALRILDIRSAITPTSEAPSIVDILLITPTSLPTSSTLAITLVGSPAVGIVSTLPLGPGDDTPAVVLTEGLTGVQVNIVVHQRTWMKVIVDGKVEFEGRVVPGTAYPFSGGETIEVLTGNGAALQVFLNQQDLGLMGNFGQVVQRIFASQGIITATPTITLTPTRTPIPSATPIPSKTPIPGEITTVPIP